MSAKSFWFETGVAGDGSSEYTEVDHSRWVRVVGACFGHEGIGPGYGTEFSAAANPTGGTDRKVRMGTGGAIVDGKPLDQDVLEDHLLDVTPSYRRDRIVLKCDWTAHTVRIAVLKGTDGSETPPTIPAPNPNTLVYQGLWQVRLISSGEVTLEADERIWAETSVDDVTIEVSDTGELRVKDDGIVAAKIAAGAVGSSEIATGAVGTSEIATDGVDSAEIKASAVKAPELATDAVETAKIKNLHVTSAKLGAGSVTAGKIAAGGVSAAAQLAANVVETAKILNNAVDDTKAGNRVPQLYRRQGGHATNWDVVGSTDYVPTAVRIQVGAAHMPAAGGGGDSSMNVIFPVPFGAKPVVLVSLNMGDYFGSVNAYVTNNEQFNIRTFGHGAAETSEVHWIAIGPE